MEATNAIAGYSYGAAGLERSPVTLGELELLKATILFGPEDERRLREAGEVLRDQIDDVLELWYGFVGSHQHLVQYFSGPDGQPDARYLERVRARFGQWIRDLCERPYDQAWLDWQHEIALRHVREKKNRTDTVDSVDEIPLRYVVACVYPITATIRAFLAKRGHASEDVDAMHQAWFKAVTLSVALWSRPRARAPGE